MSLQNTTWQTVGPYFRIGLEYAFDADIAGEGAKGQRIKIQGRVVDGDGVPIRDAVLEIWQANFEGKYAHPADTQDKVLEAGFRGFGRIPTDDDGIFRFATIRPGATPGPNGTMQAPHLVVSLMMRGLLRGLVTRAYFPNEPLNGSDPVLQLVGAARQPTMMLQVWPEREDVYTWEIRMQGDNETVFLDF